MNAAEACNRITAFNNAYVRRLEARRAGDQEGAIRAHMDMADLSMAVQRDVEKVDRGAIILRDAPAAGGRERPTRLVDVVLTDLEAQYNIDPMMIQTMLRQAVAEHEAMFDRRAHRWLWRRLQLLVLLPVLVILTVVAVLREHYKALAAVLGSAAAVLTILQVLGRLF